MACDTPDFETNTWRVPGPCAPNGEVRPQRRALGCLRVRADWQPPAVQRRRLLVSRDRRKWKGDRRSI